VRNVWGGGEAAREGSLEVEADVLTTPAQLEPDADELEEPEPSAWIPRMDAEELISEVRTGEVILALLLRDLVTGPFFGVLGFFVGLDFKKISFSSS